MYPITNKVEYCALEKVLFVERGYALEDIKRVAGEIPNLSRVELNVLFPRLEQKGLRIVEGWSSKLVMGDSNKQSLVKMDEAIEKERLRGYELVGMTSYGEMELLFRPFVRTQGYFPLLGFGWQTFFGAKVYCQEGIECQVKYRGDVLRTQEMRGVVELLQEMYLLKEKS